MRYLTFIVIAFFIATGILSCDKGKAVVKTENSGSAEVSAMRQADSLARVQSMSTDTMIYYHRGACFGMCPMFTFVVYQDGHAVYEGRNHVDRIGFYRTQINEAALQNVIREAEQLGYFGLQEVYDNPYVTDLPMVKTAMRSKDGRLKYVFDRYKGPAGMKKIYTTLDNLIEGQQWEPTGK